MSFLNSKCAIPWRSRARAIAQYSIAEGGPPPKNIIVVEFPSMKKLRQWYASPEYAEALKVRQTALDRRLIFVEGVVVAT